MRRQPEALRNALATLDQSALRRERRVIQHHLDTGAGARVVVDGRLLINFCSNDYLGIAHHPALAVAQQHAIEEFGSGSGAAHLLTGHSRHHHALEEELAAFTGRERALLFSTGYMANLGAISALSGRGEAVVQDRLNHASLLDGARLAGARLLRYPHVDVVAAARILETQASANLLVTDAVFSMDGDLAPLAELATVCCRHQTWLLADDAHGFGVLGETGAGTLEHLRLDAAAVPLLMGTLGKALGCFGAFLAGDADLIEFLMQKARTYIYTTAPPPAVAAAARAALQLCQSEGWRREQLRQRIQRFQQGAGQLGIPLQDSITAIQPLVVGEPGLALELSNALLQAGFWVSAIRPPTVPKGSSRLRITLSVSHRDDEIDSLLDALAHQLRRRPQAIDTA